MDPTAPKDNDFNNDPQPSTPGGTVPNPIQPGQFVVAEENTKQATQSNSPPNIEDPIQSANQTPVQTPPQYQQSQMGGPRVENQAPFNTASTQQDTPINPFPQQSPSMNSAQPDPTPFNPIQPTMPPMQESSKMNKIKLIVIIVAVLALVGIIAAVVWFFVLGPQKAGESTKTQNTQETVEDLSPPPKRPEGGFGEIPQATGEATPGAQTP